MLELFAAKQGDADAAAGLMAMSCIFWIVFLFLGIGGFIAGILYLLALSKALSRCRPRNRTMEPGQVWLMLIPFFGVVWQFFVVNRVSESLKKEFRSRGWSANDDFGASLGIWYCALGLVPCVDLISIVLWIMYWSKIAGFSKQLATGDGGDGDEDMDEEEDEDRPRRRRQRHDDDDEDELR